LILDTGQLSLVTGHLSFASGLGYWLIASGQFAFASLIYNL
jgi:hypothetical protein